MIHRCAVTDTLGRRPQNRKLRANNAIEKIKKEQLTKDRVTAKSLVLHASSIYPDKTLDT
jgi:hypothetical protein